LHTVCHEISYNGTRKTSQFGNTSCLKEFIGEMFIMLHVIKHLVGQLIVCTVGSYKQNTKLHSYMHKVNTPTEDVSKVV